jgi:prevent-host-death family protein
MQIGIRDLKAKASELVRRAQKGERVVITSRGLPVAVLGPLPTLPEKREDVRSHLWSIGEDIRKQWRGSVSAIEALLENRR